MLAVRAVGGKRRVMMIPLEMRPDLVLDAGPIGDIGRIFGAGVAGQVGINGQRVAAGGVIERLHAPRLRTDAAQDSNLIYIPNKRRLPVNRLADPLQCFVSRKMIRGFLAAHARERIGKERITSPDAKLETILWRGKRLRQ